MHGRRGSRVYPDSDFFCLASPPQQGAVHACANHPSFSTFLFLDSQVVLVFFSIPFFHVERTCDELCLSECLILELGTLRRRRLLEWGG